MGRIVLSAVGFVLVGGAIVGYSWETVTQLLAGQWRGTRVALTVVALVFLLVVLRRLAGAIHAWDASDTPGDPSGDPSSTPTTR